MSNSSLSSNPIHPSALIEEGASVAPDVKIGPFCVVGKNACLESGVILHSHVVVDGYTTIGERTEVFPFVSLGSKPQDLKYAGEISKLIIGKNNVIREHVTMNPGTAGGGMITRIGDNGLFMVSSLSQVIIPESYSLSEAYPNPFNPVTTLSFAIPVDNEVTLSIYNLQGREVASLINGNMKAGYHSTTWDASANASGVYFVKMMAGEYVNTQKLMLIK